MVFGIPVTFSSVSPCTIDPSNTILFVFMCVSFNTRNLLQLHIAVDRPVRVAALVPGELLPAVGLVGVVAGDRRGGRGRDRGRGAGGG